MNSQNIYIALHLEKIHEHDNFNQTMARKWSGLSNALRKFETSKKKNNKKTKQNKKKEKMTKLTKFLTHLEYIILR